MQVFSGRRIKGAACSREGERMVRSNVEPRALSPLLSARSRGPRSRIHAHADTIELFSSFHPCILSLCDTVSRACNHVHLVAKFLRNAGSPTPWFVRDQTPP